jgi:transposase
LICHSLRLVDDPDERIGVPTPAACRCGTSLAEAPVVGVRRRQVHDLPPIPDPVVTEYRADVVIGHHVPVHRSTILVMELLGLQVSAGFAASLRGRAAALIRDGGFLDAVKRLLASAPVVHADETFTRAAGGTAFVHVACTGPSDRIQRPVDDAVPCSGDSSSRSTASAPTARGGVPTTASNACATRGGSVIQCS